MKNLLLLVIVFAIGCWAVPKPMESIENYNVMLLHGAYESGKGVAENSELPSAYDESDYLGGDANLGKYEKDSRITKWLSKNVFEEPDIGKNRNPCNSYVYHWRAFTNSANSSINNAHELGDRKWNGCGNRRSLVEESQEVRAVFDNASTGRKDSG